MSTGTDILSSTSPKKPYDSGICRVTVSTGLMSTNLPSSAFPYARDSSNAIAAPINHPTTLNKAPPTHPKMPTARGKSGKELTGATTIAKTVMSTYSAAPSMELLTACSRKAVLDCTIYETPMNKNTVTNAATSGRGDFIAIVFGPGQTAQALLFGCLVNRYVLQAYVLIIAYSSTALFFELPPLWSTLQDTLYERSHGCKFSNVVDWVCMEPRRFFVGRTAGILVLLVVAGSIYLFFNNRAAEPINSHADLIRINSPRSNQSVASPLTILGEARGNWFFEASFPVFLTDWDGRILAQGIATAKSEWMTTDFVPFEATLTFTVDKNPYSNRGTPILLKDNPSGLSIYDDALEIPVVFTGVTGNTNPPPIACTQEAKICPDGSVVGRVGPNCEFAPCP